MIFQAVYGIWTAFIIERTISKIYPDSSFVVARNWNDVDPILIAKIFTESKGRNSVSVIHINYFIDLFYIVLADFYHK
jgi:hypothetical protein